MEIDCSHDDFTAVSPSEDFKIKVLYNRPIEGAFPLSPSREVLN
jgi:hypothetical protein